MADNGTVTIETQARRTEDGCVRVSLRTHSPDGRLRKFGRVMKDDGATDEISRTRCTIIARMGFMAAGCAARGLPVTTSNANMVVGQHADEITEFGECIWDQFRHNRVGVYA